MRHATRWHGASSLPAKAPEPKASAEVEPYSLAGAAAILPALKRAKKRSEDGGEEGADDEELEIGEEGGDAGEDAALLAARPRRAPAAQVTPEELKGLILRTRARCPRGSRRGSSRAHSVGDTPLKIKRRLWK